MRNLLAVAASLALAACGSTAAPAPAEAFCESLASAAAGCGGSACDRALAGECASMAALLDERFLREADACLAGGTAPGTCFAGAIAALAPGDAQRNFASSFCASCLGGVPGCVEGFFASPAGLVVMPLSPAVLAELETECAQGALCASSFPVCAQGVLARRSLSAETAACLLQQLSAPEGGTCELDGGLDAASPPGDAGPRDAGRDAGARDAGRDAAAPIDGGTRSPIVLDRSFGTDGQVWLTGGARNDWVVTGCAVGSDRSVVLGGHEDNQALFVRLSASGALDPSFGTGGAVVRPYAALNGIALTSDDRPVAITLNNVVRLTRDGSADSSFDGDGIATVRVNLLSVSLDSVAVGPDDRVVAGGSSAETVVTSASDYLIARLRPDGSFDSSFDGDGITVYSRVSGPRSTRDEYARSVSIDGSGRVVTSGNGVMLRFTSGGAIDTSFGAGGVVETAGRIAYESRARADGRVMQSWYGADGALSRFDDRGVLETAFGEGGFAPVCESSSSHAIVVRDGGDTLVGCGDGTLEAYDASGVTRMEPLPAPPVTLPSGEPARLYTDALCLGPDGSVVAVGRVSLRAGVWIARYVDRAP